ncbi:MAG: carboxypeptidase regulatory-like domain-containing protein, partial [Thiotrichaceae bacterium]|nr:carboxypeptidase regulatory-like domain-containing protein [Thiotrichaceae bacterium]
AGRFTDEAGGALDAAQVILKQPDSPLQLDKTTTNSKAEYLFANLQAGTYTVQASKNLGRNEDVVSSLETVQLAAGENVIVNLIGKQVTIIDQGTIKGRVLDENNTPVVKAQVTVTPADQKQISGSKGEFLFKDLKPDTYALQASIKLISETIFTDAVKVRLAAGDNKDIKLIFKKISEATGGLDIELMDSAAGKKVSKAIVAIRHESDRQETASLDKPNSPTQHFIFSTIKTGSYIVSVKAAGFKAFTSTAVKVVANKNTKKTFRLIRLS